jgi:hypothetical protein
MVEQIAKELLTDPAPIPRPAGCVPGQSTGCGGRAGCHGFQVCASDGTRYEPCVCGD